MSHGYEKVVIRWCKVWTVAKSRHYFQLRMFLMFVLGQIDNLCWSIAAGERVFNWPMLGSGFSKHRVSVSFVDHNSVQGTTLEIIWPSVQIARVWQQVLEFDRNEATVSCYYDYEHRSIFQHQIQFNAKTGHLEDLPAAVCKCPHVVQIGYWSLHEEFLDMICSRGRDYRQRWRLMVLIKYQVLSTIYGCCAAIPSPVSSSKTECLPDIGLSSRQDSFSLLLPGALTSLISFAATLALSVLIFHA